MQRRWCGLVSETFLARFEAFCRGCGDDIDEGDPVGFVYGEKGLHCLDCVHEAGWDAYWEPATDGEE